jgi:hypothetical protein
MVGMVVGVVVCLLPVLASLRCNQHPLHLGCMLGVQIVLVLGCFTFAA